MKVTVKDTRISKKISFREISVGAWFELSAEWQDKLNLSSESVSVKTGPDTYLRYDLTTNECFYGRDFVNAGVEVHELEVEIVIK